MFTAADEGGTGSFQTTPIVAEGCVYMTTGSGQIYALNADTGEVVWKGRFAETVSGVCCGSTLFAPTVKDGVLYQLVSRNSDTAGRGKGPYAIALNSQTGKEIWKSESVATEPGAYTNASTVLYDGLIFFGISGAEGGNQNAGGYAILDAKTGKILMRVHTVPQSQVEDGYGGGSIWSTAAVDTKTGYAYAGTGQPTNPNREHERINAILKIDLNRGHGTFGEIVDAYKATPDSKLQSSPACQSGPPEASTASCVYTDVDFSASPTLLKDSRGNPLVVEYQKSGVLHAAHRDTMQRAWEATLSGIGAPAGNYASTATDGTSVFGVGTYPGQMFSIGRDFGSYQWVAPVVTTVGANPVTYANGVVLTADGKGFLDAYDSATGVPLLHHSMQSDVGAQCLNTGGGVAIARNTVYAVCGERDVTFGPSDVATGWVIAYQF
jgi:outer membrane protein assembly factor BamB